MGINFLRELADVRKIAEESRMIATETNALARSHIAACEVSRKEAEAWRTGAKQSIDEVAKSIQSLRNWVVTLIITGAASVIVGLVTVLAHYVLKGG